MSFSFGDTMMKSILLIVVGIVIALSAGCARSTHPSDSALLQRFDTNEADLERLLTMLREDPKLQRVDDTWTNPSDPSSIGVSAERIATYRRLFAKLGIPRGFYAFHAPERFTFLASTFGLSVSGSAKGYAYLENKPVLIVSSLDTYWSSDNRSFTAYRHIKGNWYLYFDYEN